MNHWPQITELDEVWERVNAMGGTIVDEFDEFGRGRNHAINTVLAIIEEFGGKDPAPTRARIEELKGAFMRKYAAALDALR